MQHLLTANDRTALRRGVRLPCQVVRDEDNTLLSTLCVDLSPHGMSARLETHQHPIELGARVRIAFRVPEAGVHMDIAGEVTRLSQGRRDGDPHAVFALRFLGLRVLDGILLSARLHGLPPPPPARRLRMDYAGSVRAIHGSLTRASAM